MNLILLFLLITPPKPPALIPTPDGQSVMVWIPCDWLEDERIQRRLFSGLTTSMELVMRADQGLPTDGIQSRMDIRWELWDEQLLATMVSGPRKHTLRFRDLQHLISFLEHVPIVLFNPSPCTGQVLRQAQITCRVIPFSAQETQRTKAWFSSIPELASESTQAQADRSRQRSTSDVPSKLLTMVMSQSIKRRVVAEYHWTALRADPMGRAP